MNRNMIKIDNLIIDINSVYAVRMNDVLSIIEFYTDSEKMLYVDVPKKMLEYTFQQLNDLIFDTTINFDTTKKAKGD